MPVTRIAYLPASPHFLLAGLAKIASGASCVDVVPLKLGPFFCIAVHVVFQLDKTQRSLQAQCTRALRPPL